RRDPAPGTAREGRLARRASADDGPRVARRSGGARVGGTGRDGIPGGGGLRRAAGEGRVGGADERSRARGARGGVLGHAEGDHLVQGGRDGGVGGRGAGGVGHEVAVHLLGGFGGAVGGAAGEGFEQHDGLGIYVGAGVRQP